MKFVAERPFNDLDADARKLVEIANAVEAVQDGRIYSWSTARSLKKAARRISNRAALARDARHIQGSAGVLAFTAVSLERSRP
jgi:hypothetical protein